MVSIVVPVYNVYPFLGECIESICSQTYTDLDIILVDDGSSDNSGSLCDKFALNDLRIRVIHQENQGLSAARNAGMQIAKGEFLMFVDSDDRIHPMMIETLYNAMQQNNMEIAICSHRRIQEMEVGDIHNQQIVIEADKIEIISGRECIQRIYYDKTPVKQKIDMTVAWNKLYRTDMFADLKYPIGRLHEDEFLTYKILFPLKRCIFLNIPLYEYRVRRGSIMENRNIIRLRDKVDAFREKYLYFEQQNDRELYYQTLKGYATSMIELIFFLKENHLEEKWVRKLNHEFRLVYREKIAGANMLFRYKAKYMLFIRSQTIYKVLQELHDNLCGIQCKLKQR